MDQANMQDIMTSNSSNAQQSVIRGAMPMNVNQQGSPNQHTLQYTATIYTQDMSAMSQNNQQQMMSMQQNRQQPNESSQAMMSDMNPFISGGLAMNQQQQSQQSEQMIAAQAEADEKEAYKNKYSRNFRSQLP